MIVVAKIGTSSITDDDGDDRRAARSTSCAPRSAALRAAGHRVVAVTSGAIAPACPRSGLGGDAGPATR